jgi:hypothetical protein
MSARSPPPDSPGWRSRDVEDDDEDGRHLDGGGYRATAESLSFVRGGGGVIGGGAGGVGSSFLPPGWWDRLPSPDRLENVIRFDRHVSHVVVPGCDDRDEDVDCGMDATTMTTTTTTVTCEEVVRWVLAAAGTIGGVDDRRYRAHSSDDKADRRSRVRAEWNEGEEAGMAAAEEASTSASHVPLSSDRRRRTVTIRRSFPNNGARPTTTIPATTTRP